MTRWYQHRIQQILPLPRRLAFQTFTVQFELGGWLFDDLDEKRINSRNDSINKTVTKLC